MSILEAKQVWRRDEADRKHRPMELTQAERDNVRRALSSLLTKHGRSELAARMELTRDALRKLLKRPPTRRVAVLVAWIAGVEPAAVLSGAWPSVCPTCGRSG
jgi:lambda repressor-like predicted transcriptional regulator